MRHPFAFWVALRSSLWFVPAILMLGSMTVARGLIEAGSHIAALSQQELPSLFQFSAEGSRATLSAIATAMITVAGVAFSITIVALSLASSQYSPRVLHQFMRDRANQWVLGVFVGIFAYCLIVLPSVRGTDGDIFVPALAVAVGVVYALAGVGCLIFFIHHVATSIQASCIVAGIAAETRASADEVFPDSLEERENDTEIPPAAGPWRSILAAESGYIQLIQEEDLLRIATRHDVMIRMEHGVGEFVVANTPIVSVVGDATDDATLAAKLMRVITINRTRTIEQDVMFGVRQITDVALRALSPSLNDPTTATLCINQLTTILHPLATRRMGNRNRSHAGKVRMIACEPDFPALLSLAFGEIRAHAGTQLVVLRGLIRGLETLAHVTRQPLRRAALAGEAEAIRDLLDGTGPDPTAGSVRAEVDRLLATLQQTA